MGARTSITRSGKRIILEAPSSPKLTRSKTRALNDADAQNTKYGGRGAGGINKADTPVIRDYSLSKETSDATDRDRLSLREQYGLLWRGPRLYIPNASNCGRTSFIGTMMVRGARTWVVPRQSIW